jgi:predicted DNA-binding transcriptional regulator AlpA
LDEKIKEADCLLVLAGMYAAHRGWIQSEIEAAQEFGKPIIAIAPRGQERFPKVTVTANETVGWTSKSIIEAVRRLAPSPTSSLQTLAGLSTTPPPLPRYPTLFAPLKTAPPPLSSLLPGHRNRFEPPKK